MVGVPHAIKTSGITYPREQIPLHCGGKVQYAWDPQKIPVKGVSAIKAVFASLTGWVSTETCLPLTSCLFLRYLVPHHCNPCAASEAVTRGSIMGMWKFVLFMNSVKIRASLQSKMYGNSRAAVQSDTVLSFLWEEFINLIGRPALAVCCFW